MSSRSWTRATRRCTPSSDSTTCPRAKPRRGTGGSTTAALKNRPAHPPRRFQHRPAVACSSSSRRWGGALVHGNERYERWISQTVAAAGSSRTNHVRSCLPLARAYHSPRRDPSSTKRHPRLPRSACGRLAGERRCAHVACDGGGGEVARPVAGGGEAVRGCLSAWPAHGLQWRLEREKRKRKEK